MSPTNHHTVTHQQATLDLSITLLERPSVTPDDDGCQDILSERLEQAGFKENIFKPLTFGIATVYKGTKK